MNHIAKLKQMARWLIVLLYIMAIPLVIVWFQILLGAFNELFTDQYVLSFFRYVGEAILADPGVVLELAVFAFLIWFMKKRVMGELERHRLRLEKWNAYIRVMEKRLKQRGLEDACGEVQDIGSAVIWRDAAQETAWLKRTLTVVQVCLWISFGLTALSSLTQLPDIYTTWHEALYDYNSWSPSTGMRWNNDLVSTTILCLMQLVIALAIPAAHLAVSITAQKKAPDEVALLEMSLREQRQRIEALESACSAANIPMDEVWAATRRTLEE